jgi:hypothetical protein
VRRLTTRGLFVFAIVAGVVVGGGGSTSKAAGGGGTTLPTCTDSQLVPNVADLSVSQGAPGYARYARGKDGVVRAYLTLPTTCTLSARNPAQSITVKSAKLFVKQNGTLVHTIAPPYSFSAGKLTTTTAQAYAVTDPLFLVPAADFTLFANDSSFSLTVTLEVTYDRVGTTTSTQTLSGTTANGGEKTVTVDRKTNALRVLVVPMGDPTSTSPQWTTTAQDPNNSSEKRLQDLMANASRAFPVPQGAISQLRTANPGEILDGFRYVINGALLDVKSLNLYTSGKFCANGSKWTDTSLVTGGPLASETLKSQLLQRLSDYNRLNVPPADMVLGVIDGSIAWKSTDGISGGCDDGRATLPDSATRTPGQVAWVRLAGASESSYPTPLQMELLHIFGIRRQTQTNLTAHSPAVEADGGSTSPTNNKGYNVMQRKVVATATGTLGTSDHSVMNYNTTSIPYTKDNTLLEPTDWNDALCGLGGLAAGDPPTFIACTLNTALGTNSGVAAGNNFFQISGIVTGPNVKVTYAAANQPGGEEVGVVGADESDLDLTLCDGDCSSAASADKQTVGLALLPDEGHTNISGGLSFEFEFGVGFNAMVEQDTRFDHAELRLNDVLVPGFPTSTGDPDPDVTGTAASTTPAGTVMRSFKPHFVDGEFTNNLCCNGRAIAFDGTYLYVTLVLDYYGGEGDPDTRIYKIRTSDGRVISTLNAGREIGALAFRESLSPTKVRLYGGDYDGFGDIYNITYDDDIDVGGLTRETMFSFDDPTCSDPFFGSNLSKYIDGLEYRPGADNLAISGDVCDRVFIKTLGGGAVEDFQTHGSDTNNSGITTDGAGGLWLARLVTPGAEDDTRLTHVKKDPSTNAWTVVDELVVPNYEAEDLAYDSVTFAPTCVIWMNQAAGNAPPAGEPTVKAVAVPCATAASSPEASVRTTNAEFVRISFTCGDPNNPANEQFPVATGLRPVNGVTEIDYTDKLFCKEGAPKLFAQASNGFEETTSADPQATTPVTAPVQPPTANIVAPLNGATVRVGEQIHYEGYASDHDQQAIVSGLRWYIKAPTVGSQFVQISEGDGKTSFDKLAPTVLGIHVIKLEATDAQGNKGSAEVTINVKPKACSTTKDC